MVALAVIAVLLSVALSRFGALRDSMSVRAAAGDLGSAFSLARQVAVSRRRVVAIVLDTGRVVHSSPAADLMADEALLDALLGVAAVPEPGGAAR